MVQPPTDEGSADDSVTLVPADDDPDHLEQLLRSAYAAGPKSVVVEFGDGATAEQQKRVRRVVRNLVGVTITEASDARVVVRNVLDANEVSVRQSVRQLQFVAVSMHRDATAALLDTDVTVDTTGRDDRADRLYAMVQRHFGRGIEHLDEIDALGETRPALLRLHETARELERIADHAECLGDVAQTVDEPLPRPLRDDVAAASEMGRDAVESAVDIVFEGSGVDDARDVLQTRDRLCADLDALERRLVDDYDGDYRYAHALYSLRRTAEHATNIAELGLRAAIHRGNDDVLERASDASRTDEQTSNV